MSRGLRLLLAVGLALTCTDEALAYFSTTGSGSAQTAAATITGPSSVTSAQTGTAVAIGWSAATLSSGTAVQGYRVDRSDGAHVCGTPTLVTTLSCTDTAAASNSTYSYTVSAIYHSWDSSASSGSITIMSAPTIGSTPPSISPSGSATLGFSGGSGSAYACKLDSGAFSACTSPAAYSGLSNGTHTFTVHATRGSSTGPDATYTWQVDATAPTQSLTLGAGATGAYLNATTLYYNANAAAGSFKLVDTVSDGGSGPASASFPALAATGWSHGTESVSSPSSGPYTSTAFTWSSGPATPPGYTVTGADAAGNTVSTVITFVNDTAAPAAGALSVNGTAATAGGSTSSVTNSTTFAIASRTDFTDATSGLKSSVLAVQSESLSGSVCGALGSGGPFTSPTTISGTTQPLGVQAGFCYRYTLTGTDNVGNVASISTTVVDNALSFTVTTQPTSVTAATATAANAVVLTAVKNGATDASYTGATLTWGGAKSSPAGTAATLPTSPTWSGGKATFGITLVKAESETLTVGDGTRSASFATITVNAGAAAKLAWTTVTTTSPAGIPTTCLFTCTYASGFGNSRTWTAHVSATDSVGNTVSNIGAGHVAVVTLNASPKGTLSPVSPASLTLPSAGTAESTGTVTYTGPTTGAFTDSLTATSAGYSSATASFTR
ncbi:MAG: hypothetical protein ACJ76X_06595 [Solirubrobacteraceae bacterium]